MAKQHTTVAVERATLRLAGLQGADTEGTPWVNRLIDVVRADVGLEHGVALPVWDALVRGEADDLATLAQKASAGSVRSGSRRAATPQRARSASRKQVGAGIRTIDRRRRERERLIARHGDAPAQAVDLPDRRDRRHLRGHPAGPAGRPRGRRRDRGDPLDRPEPARLRARGPTREGYAGTYATQENFRLMRAALDESSKELGRYVRLTNYASGLCMPEIAALAGLERLDMMLNDSMYGILFRDINPVRTFVDQRFSRQVHARAGIIINTGEDNYLTTADAVEAAHTVTTSQLLNEYFAKEAGPRGLAARPGPRLRDRPRDARLVPARARPRDAGPRPVPEGPAEVDAADPAHDRRRLPRLPARRLLQPGRRAHRPGHPAGRDDDRGGGDAVALRPRPGPAERPLRDERRRQAARGLPPGPRRVHRQARPAGAGGVDRPARTRSSTTSTACSTRSPTAPSA